MRTPKEYTDNLKKKTITESMLLDCLYSVNKRAKNYRDKERGYRQYYRGNRYAYDKYGNIDHCQVMKEEYYSQKEKLLSVLEPTCIHKEFIGYKRIRIYDYEPEYRKNLKILCGRTVSLIQKKTEKYGLEMWKTKTTRNIITTCSTILMVQKPSTPRSKKKIFLSTTWKSLRSIIFKRKAMKSQSWFPHSL